MTMTDLNQVARHMIQALLPPEAVPLSAVEDKRFTPPKGFKAYQSLEQGDCFFSSISRMVYGTDDGKDMIRLGSGLFGLLYVNSYIEKFIAEGVCAHQFLLEASRDDVIGGLQLMTDERELLRQVLIREAQLTLRPSSYSGFLQVLFAAGYLQKKIKQYQELTVCSMANLYTTIVRPYPKLLAGEEEPLYVMWVKTGVASVPNHVVPLEKVVRGRLQVESSWGWLKPGTKCKAATIGWCTCGITPTIGTTPTMISCDQCKSVCNPECFGIARHFYSNKGKKPFICCGDVSAVPKLIITRHSSVAIHLADLVSLQPGNCLTNWVIDYFMDTTMSAETSLHCGCLPTIAWEVAVKNNAQQIKRHQRLWQTLMEKPVVMFVVVESGHFLMGAFLQMHKEVLFMDSISQERHVYQSYAKKLKRLMGIEDMTMVIESLPTHQQNNAVDCGVHTIFNIEAMFKIFQKGSCKDVFSKIEKIPVIKPEKIRRELKEQILKKQLQQCV